MHTYVSIPPPSCISLPPTLSIPPLQVVTKHPADLPVLCGCFPLAIYFTFWPHILDSSFPLPLPPLALTVKSSPAACFLSPPIHLLHYTPTANRALNTKSPVIFFYFFSQPLYSLIVLHVPVIVVFCFQHKTKLPL